MKKINRIKYIILLIFPVLLLGQQQNYVRVNNQGDSTYYRVTQISKTFKTINNKGKLINKGTIRSLTGFEDDSEFFSGGEFDVYPANDYYDYPEGLPVFSVLYKMINSKLNGIHFVGGLETVNNKTTFNPDKNFLSIIDNNIVYSNFQSRKAQREARFQNEYRNWKNIALELDGMIFSTPKDHDPEKLYYDLELMVDIFLNDFISYLEEASKNLEIFKKNNLNTANFNQLIIQLNSLKNLIEKNSIYSIFEELEGDTIALSNGLGQDSNINIIVDPSKWLVSTPATRWYILYHELGHDVLNLKHGQGGRMMFNYPTKNYTWKDFFNDRHEMFMFFLNKNYPDNEIFFPMNLN